MNKLCEVQIKKNHRRSKFYFLCSSIRTAKALENNFEVGGCVVSTCFFLRDEVVRGLAVFVARAVVGCRQVSFPPREVALHDGRCGELSNSQCARKQVIQMSRF